MAGKSPLLLHTQQNEDDSDDDIFEDAEPFEIIDIVDLENIDNTDKTDRSIESEICEAISEVGLDENVWIPNIQNEFKFENSESLKSVSKEKVEEFVEAEHRSFHEPLRQAFTNLTGVDMRRTEAVVRQKEVSQIPLRMGRNLTASQAVRSLENGAVCRGIYFSENIDEITKEREVVFDVRNDLQFKSVSFVQPIFLHEFTSKDKMQVFVQNIDKHIAARSVSTGVNVWGIGIEADSGGGGGEGCYVCSVNYQLIPIESVKLDPGDIELTTEVISALQRIEQSLKSVDYVPGDHFKAFFEKYGTHISHGVIEFGGIIVSIAECAGFKEEDRSKVSGVVTEASEAALLLEVNEKVRHGEPFNAHQVLGRTMGMSAEDLQNITVTLQKIGGQSGAREKEEWKQGLKRNDSEWNIINRCSFPKPIWQMLPKYHDEFEDSEKIALVMRDEWGKNVCDSTKNTRKDGILRSERVKYKEEKRKKMTEVKQIDRLRQEIKQWIERRTFDDDEDIKLLAELKTRFSGTAEHWQREVLCLRDVQKILTSAANHLLKTEDREKTQQLALLLKFVLRPFDAIQADHFPNIRKISLSIQEYYVIDRVEIYRLENFGQLSELWEDYKKQINLEEKHRNHPIRHMQRKLESTVKSMAECPVKSYDYLIGVGVLQIFGFNIQKFQFEYQLLKYDMDNICEQLEAALRGFDTIQSTNHKQAYILRLALYAMDHREKAVQYMMNETPDALCAEFTMNRLDLKKLERVVKDLLHDLRLDFNLESVIHSFQCQLNFLHRMDRCQPRNQPDDSTTDLIPEDLKLSVEKILDALGLKRYYPGKLTCEEVTMLTGDVHDDVNKKPTSLTQLPWYFMKHIFALDSDTRENCHVVYEHNINDDDNSDSDSDNADDYDDSITTIHAEDLIYAIFLCADDLLRQELADKMARCQYAVPFIMPTSKNSGPKNLVLHWALKGITRSFHQNEKDLNKTLVDVETPLVTFMSAGGDTSWMPRLLNKMLSPQQETFWHQELKGGNSKQRISKGMVEVAWSLPGRHGDNKFPYPVTFTLVRDKATNSKIVCDQLYNASSLTCLFVEDINDDLTRFLLSRKTLNKIVLVILHRKEDRKKMKQKTAKLQETFQLKEHQIIRSAADGANFHVVYENIKMAIENILSDVRQISSLSSVVLETRKSEDMEVDDRKCFHGYMAAKSILQDIDELNRKQPGNAKAMILPCQSDLVSRREMADLDKELCRQRKLREGTNIEQYAFDIKSKKWKRQLNQLQQPVSKTFKYFLRCLLNFDIVDRKYFLQCLKIGLNERSVQLLQPLYDEYEKCRTEDESEERDKKLKSLDEQLMHGSLGCEHFFREIAVLSENTVALREKAGSKFHDLDELLDVLSSTMASLLMEGTAIEIMDGDAVNVPVAWLTAVLKKVEDSSRKTVFKVSAIGAQSCGKSTLLNTGFGLNFSVSSGRCTRGAYMQLVKVDESLKEILKCDFVAVIDTEGLMSRTKLGSSDYGYDNELSTFIIGLSDLTLVVIKGEGTEMQNVLPLAIHVFLRMNILGEHQACHFVHQNMGAVDVMTKQKTEIDTFVRDLNAKTWAAAKDADFCDHYAKFTDVIQYNPNEDNTHVPGLWDGVLPMGKTNSHYAKSTQKLTSDIVNHALDMQTKKNKRPGTFRDLAARLDELWNAIKYENFVFSFRNVLAVEAHRRLANIFDVKQWEIKKHVREMIQEEKHVIENEIFGGPTDRSVGQLTGSASLILTNYVHDEVAKLDTTMDHYFKCGGCKDCDVSVANRHLLVNNEIEFKEEVKAVKRALLKEVDVSLENLAFRMKTTKRLHELNRGMDEVLTKKVQEAISTRKSEGLTREAVEQIFEELWKEAVGDIIRNAPRADRNENIEATVQATVLSILGADAFLYRQVKMERDKGLDKLRKKSKRKMEAPTVVFTVDGSKHINLRSIWLRAVSAVTSMVNDQDVHRLQMESEKIIEITKKYYDTKTSPQGRQFNQGEVEELFKDVLRQIAEINDERFRTTTEYKVSMVHFIERRAVAAFTDMHIKYCDESSPEALLEQKKVSYHGIFVDQMGQGNAAVTFCDTALKTIILTNIEEQLSCTELLDALRNHPDELFRDVKSIQAAIMDDLMKTNIFDKFIGYITNYEMYVKCMMRKESVRFFDYDDHLKNLAKNKLENVMEAVKKAVDETVQDLPDQEPFINTFLAKIGTLKIPQAEITAFLELPKEPEKYQFAAIIHQQLEDSLRKDVLQIIDSWETLDKLEEKGLIEFLFKEIIGCDARCPFCKVPCDAHSGSRTQGNHSATLHRPQGLGGYRSTKTDKLIARDCCSDIGSNAMFSHGEDGKESTYYTKYKKVYPDWYIQSDANPDSEKYWKWVLANHNAEFAEYYSATKADVPEQWTRYSEAAVAKDVADNYSPHLIELTETGTNAKRDSAVNRGVRMVFKYIRYLLFKPNIATDKPKPPEPPDVPIETALGYMPL